jgi:hypothetical protein
MNANEAKLFKVAEAQQGCFTAKQAIACGYAKPNHPYHVRTGAWVREYRGIYRLARFPAAPEGQYVLWTLWSSNRHEIPQGVFSHQTALSLQELSDVMPAKLHMTVPPGFRRNSALPKILTLHRASLPESDIEPRQGYRIIRPLRAIVDLLHDGAESRDRLRQALAQALARGLITRTGIRNHPERKALEALLTGGGP